MSNLKLATNKNSYWHYAYGVPIGCNFQDVIFFFINECEVVIFYTPEYSTDITLVF